MKKLLLVTAALLAATPAVQAHTSENVLFTCEGELIKFQGNDGKNYHAIVESWKEEERVNCDIAEGKALRQVLAVCRVGLHSRCKRRKWQRTLLSDSKGL